MKEFEIMFLSAKSSFSMKMKSDQIEIDQFLLEFLSLFSNVVDAENSRIGIANYQQNTKGLKEHFQEFVNRYKDTMPQVHRLRQFIEQLAENEYFFLAPAAKLSSQENMEVTTKLEALNRNKDLGALSKEYQDIFGSLINNYEITGYDNSKRFPPIGESDRTKRVCRFCGKSEPEVHFRQTAHAISEAFGNKTIILNEECDTCNTKFEEEAERDLINYLDMYRVFFTVKGKSGVPAMKGKDFTFKHLGNRNFAFHYRPADPASQGVPASIVVDTNNVIALQNLYRTLCKYALSVAESEYLEYFKNTIKWMMGEVSHSPLPKVASLFTYDLTDFVSPAIIIYRRKNNDRSLPHMIGEFHFTCFVFVFIVPFSSEDDQATDAQKVFDNFWKLSQFTKIKEGEWKFVDLSDSKKRKLEFKINFKKRE